MNMINKETSIWNNENENSLDLKKDPWEEHTEGHDEIMARLKLEEEERAWGINICVIKW